MTTGTGKHKVPNLVGEHAAKKKKKFMHQCVICLEKHHTSGCEQLLGPKLQAICCGLGGKVIFPIPYDTVAPVPKKVLAFAPITIVQGEVSAELVKVELVRLIPVKWTGWSYHMAKINT